MLIKCPNCGPRAVDEFDFGGEWHGGPPAAPDLRSWFGYVYERTNGAGLQTEWWFHRLGCQLWFFAERDTVTNKIAGTKLP